MKLSFKMVLALIVAGLLLSMGIALSFRTYQQIADTADARKHAAQVISSAEEFLSALKDAETGERGFLLTGNEAFLQPYLAVRDGVMVQLQALQQKTQLASAKSQLDALAPLVQRRMADLAHAIELGRAHNTAEILRLVNIGQGKQQMDTIRTQIHTFVQMEEAGLAEREAAYQASLRSLFGVIVAASALGLLAALGFAYLIYRQGLQRLNQQVLEETRYLLEQQEVLNQQLQHSNQALQISEEQLAVTLNSIGDGVITTDAQARVTSLNPLAERLTGWNEEAARGQPIEDVLHIVNKSSREPVVIPVMAALLHGSVQALANHTVLLSRDGREYDIADSCAPIRARDEQVIGSVLVFRDVTEEYALQQATRDSGVLMQTVLNTVADGILTLHGEGFLLETVNPAIEEMFGYAASDMVGRDIRLLIPGFSSVPVAVDDADMQGHALLPAAKSAREAQGRRQDGSLFTLEIALNEMWLGGELHYTGVLRDYTTRKLAEEALLKAGALQKAIFDSANFSSIATDARGVIQIFNVGAERMLGYTALEVMNKNTPADISDPQELIARAQALSAELETPIAPGFEALVFKASRGIEDIYELTYIRKDGSRFPAVVSVTALRDDEAAIIGYLLIGTDNTARKQIEEERKKLDQRLRDQQFYTRSLIESNIDAIMTTDPAGIITDVNKQMEALTECTRDELIGAPLKKYFTDPDRVVAVMNSVLSGKKITNYDLTVRARSGKETAISYSATTFHDRERVLQGVFAAARDVTESKRLDQVLQEKNIELESARRVADKANLAKSDFLSSMSHEIRSPLNAILGLAYLLEQAKLDMDSNNMVRKIRASGRMLLSLISDILDVSKIEAGQMMIEQAPFRLVDVIENLSVVLGVAVGEKNIQLIIQPPPVGAFTLIGDALRLEQVLINLSINAIKFTHIGEVELRTELVSRNSEQIILRFSVRDTGIGIAPELQGGVFAAFTQADSSTTRRFGGTGLGLTICRQLVHLMGGEIGLTSVQGQGSEFWFTVPLKTVADTGPAASATVRVEALIANSNDAELQLVSGIALGLGWQVCSLASGEEVIANALGRNGEKLPDVVVLDWKMGALDGLATARALRDRVAQEKCPLLIMTTAHAHASNSSAELVDAVLEKPITPTSLYNAVIEAKRKRAATVGTSFALHQSAGQGLLGIRVLVVDDSEINCEVALRILRGQGAIVSLAADGQEALDWLLAHPDDIDLVLMDVQMPVMDGIEATRQLRLIPRFADLPIIALTAGAFKSQQDAAEAVGMAHFISKPFDVPSTIALIQRLYRRPPSTLGGGARPAEARSPMDIAAPLPAATVMDVVQGLNIWIDRASYQEYLRRFVDLYGGTVRAMRESLAQGYRPAATALAHKLSGVAANLALPEVRRLAEQVERVLLTELDASVELQQLDAAMGLALAEIECFLQIAE